MRKRLIYSLGILFLLFSLGAGISMFYSHKITRDLESVISLHRIEIIRQNLVISTQQVQSNLYAEGTTFGKELDITVDNVMALDNAINSCVGCHHNKDMTEKLNVLHTVVHQYKEAISFLVTSTANQERISRLKSVAIGIGDSLITKTQEMAIIADRSLSAKTANAVREMQHARIILLVTLALSLVIALLIAASLTRQITRPVDQLVDGARMIATGALGHTVDYNEDNEFGEVAKSFNVMSSALQQERQKRDRFIEQLSGLYKITIVLYTISEIRDIYQEICNDIAGLFRVRQCVLILNDHASGMYTAHAAAPPLPRDNFAMERRQMESVASAAGGQTVLINSSGEGAAYYPLVPDDAGEENFLIVWLHKKTEVIGALRLSGKEGPFVEEDSRLITILANHLSVAMENAELYQDLQDKMLELRDTQEQLIQSAKLAAIGELASNVAHEINNPLTSIMGFAEMTRDEEDIAAIRSHIEIIEKESVRARDIVRELLTFARKKPLEFVETDINTIIAELIPLVKNQAAANRVKIIEDYGTLPGTLVDPNQLKQVFINIITNAIASMSDLGGKLSIRTSAVGEYLIITISDTGSGIPKEILNKIFEPFFTTKKDKGTGLGLSISYRIIKDHGGRIDVESSDAQGTSFIIRLPLRLAAKADPVTAHQPT